MALAPDGKTLFVACANSTRSACWTSANGKDLETINCALYPAAPAGNTPSSLSLTPDGKLLFVANADANNLAVFNVAEAGRRQAAGLHPDRLVSDRCPLQRGRQEALRRQRQGPVVAANPQGPHPHQVANLRPHVPVHRRSDAGHAQHHRHADDPSRWRRTPSRPMRAARCKQDRGVVGERPEDNPIPARSATRVRSSTASTSSRRTAPTIRSSAT